MKNHIVSLFILLTYFISGCEDSAVNNKTTQDLLKVTTTQKPVSEETKKQTVLYKQAKTVVKKKAPQSEFKETPGLTDPPQSKQVLDLSIPLRLQKTTISDNPPNNEQRDYLPDFFADKKNQKKDTVQIDGKIIRREEEEIDKQRTVDGVGIGIKLIP